MKIKDILIFNIIILLVLIIGILTINNQQAYRILFYSLSLFAILINGYIFDLLDRQEYKSEGAKFLYIDIKNNIFKDNKEFTQYVYNNYCQCSNQCIDMPENLDKQIGYCSEIVLDKDINKFLKYDNVISNAISYLININLLTRSGIHFYIKSNNLNLKFTWNNIKTLKNEEHKKLFWLLRKLIVDAILKRILLKRFKNDPLVCKIFSVGSTKITSDYDITLYGNDKNKVTIINEFQQIFKRYFADNSSIIFDTNIYGKAFIYYFPRDPKFSLNIINRYQDQFYYLKPYLYENSKLINLNSQLVWALIKFLKDLSNGFDEKIFNELSEYYNNKLNYKLFTIAQETLFFLENQDNNKINYSSIMNMSDEIEKIYNDNLINIISDQNLDEISIIKEHELIGITNFYGSEVYYTRGAFLNTVVNQQMLMNKDKLLLLDIEYITSIIENAGFFLVHNAKSKYIIRVQKSLTDLINNYNDIYNPLTKNLDEINNIIQSFSINNDFDSNYCKWISNNNTKLDLLKCEKYKIFNAIFNLIYEILNITKNTYNIFNDNHIVPFYEYFVTKPNKIFELEKSYKTQSIIKSLNEIEIIMQKN